MSHSQITNSARSLWLFTAMTAPLCQMAGKITWITVLLLCVVTVPLCWGTYALSGGILNQYKWLCALQIPILTIALTEFVRWSADAWPTGTDFPVVPLTLLALAMLSAFRGAADASRVPTVLFWFVALLFAVVLVFGGQILQTDHLQFKWSLPDMPVLVILLVPAVMGLFPGKQEKGMLLTFGGTAAFFLVATLFTQGALGTAVCGKESWPFYTASKSLGISGFAERFESLVSVAMTMGYFALYSLLLSCIWHMAENIRRDCGKWAVVCSGIVTGGWLLAFPELDMRILVILALLGWILVPLFVGFVGNVKKTQKRKNNP